MSSERRTLLVNFVYTSPAGHAIEGLRYCAGYYHADPSLRIHLALNGTTATELADFCPFIERTYSVRFGEPGEVDEPEDALRKIPRRWDYLVVEPRSEYLDQLPDAVRRYYEAANVYFQGELHRGPAGLSPPAYEPQPLRLELPEHTRRRAQRLLGGRPAIAIVPAGSSWDRWLYPSACSWELILRKLSAQHPEVLLCLVGKLTENERTSTQLAAAEVERLLGACPGALDYFDKPLEDQLALVEQCRLFLSPHTGFGYAALAVGTPWLTLSGGRWHEQFCNGVPFHSVLPDRARYPCYTHPEPLPVLPEDTDGEGPRTPSMSRARIEEDLPELLAGARELFDGRLSYEQALDRHFPRLLAVYGGDRSRIGSFDGMHLQYL